MPSIPAKSIEVETRFYFRDQAEAFGCLPFLSSCFSRANRWKTVHYGLKLLQQDIVLRIGETIHPEGHRSFLGWKGRDTGSFANIRAELDEEITHGITHSLILKELGGQTEQASVTAVIAELARLGHPPFMEFAGENQFGFYEPQNLHLKLFYCSAVRYPYLLEIEKTAHTPEQALELEAELLAFTRQHHLEKRVVRDEPPTLLYQALFNKL